MWTNTVFKSLILTGYFICLALLVRAQITGAQNNSIRGTILINAFKQNKKVNNCAAIALIKASIGTFGLNGVLTTQHRTDSTFTYMLRNKERVTISTRELHYSIAKSSILQNPTDSISNQVRMLADTCFAVMCKQQQLKDSTTFEAAVWQLNFGYKTPEIASLLGVQFTPVQSLSAKKLSRYPHLVVYNYYHAAYATNGYYDFAENSSGQAPIRNFKWNHREANHTYDPYFCDIKEGLLVVDQFRSKLIKEAN